jgi:hypothetical protein
MSLHYNGKKVLDIMSQYAPNRNRSIEALIRKNIFEKIKTPARVMEFGAGKGEFAFRFLNIPGIELHAVEIDKLYRQILEKKVRTFETIEETEKKYDAIYLIDVLEHIEDDAMMLKKLFERLNYGGRIFIYVPARMELFSEFDKSIGHFRRYSLRQLKRMVKDAGFIIEKSRYHELSGYFASAANKLFNKSGNLNPKAVRFYDKWLLPVSNIVESIGPITIGKSIYICATVPRRVEPHL